MTEKEFRKLKSLDLIQMLLTQSNEEAKLQEELDRQKQHVDELREHNDSLKAELNDKDALIEALKQELNQSDADIRRLREELRELYTDKRIDMDRIGSLTEAARQINHIFDMAQQEADEYLAHPELVYELPDYFDPEEAAIDPAAETAEISVSAAAPEAAGLIPETAIAETAACEAESPAERKEASETEMMAETAVMPEAAAPDETGIADTGTDINTETKTGIEIEAGTESEVETESVLQAAADTNIASETQTQSGGTIGASKKAPSDSRWSKGLFKSLKRNKG